MFNEDFPLRGHVVCADCGIPLTACWSKGSHSRHPYYLCPKRGCDSYGKSIRRAKIEGEFEELLSNATPSETLFKIATAMFKDLWDDCLAQAESRSKALAAQLVKIDKQVSQFLERILDASAPSVISAYEERIQKLEMEKRIIKEKAFEVTKPASTFDGILRAALEFLANPMNL